VSDLQCPVRVHLADPGDGDRIAAVVDLSAASVPQALEAVADLADLHRGEAVEVRLPDDVRRELARRLVGDPAAVLLEGDADGWVARDPG
jgi:putative NIF3 family GTP cyclohydrolase 1 type 2